MNTCISIRAKKYSKRITSLFLMTALLLLLSIISVDIFHLSRTQSASALISNGSTTFDSIANNLKIQTTSNINKTITLTGTDPIPNDILKFSVVNLPFNGNLSDGKSFNTIVYTPNHGFVGHDRFTYRATDGRGEVSNTATVFITVNAPPPPPPTAKNLKVQTTSNSNVTIMLNGTDPIKGDRLKFSVVDLPVNGMLLKGKTPDSIIYKSDEGFIGNDIFTYRSTDRLRVNSCIATVYITVNAQAPKSTLSPSSTPQPTAKNLSISTNANTPVQITLNGSSTIKGDTLRFSVVTMPLHGNLSNPTSNTVTYAPNAGFSGPDSFTYHGTDGKGVKSAIAIVSIIVNRPSSPLSPPPPTQQPTVNMITNVSSGTVDQFGIKEIYPTKLGGEQWFMNMNDPNHDNRTDPKTTLTKNPDGSWKVTSNEVRFQVFTSSGYHHNLISTLNQQQLAAKGYMQSPNDWKNIEMTGYVKLNKQGGDVRGASGSLLGGHFTWYARGGKHTGQGSPLGCEATSYHVDWAYNGKTRFAKEQWHVSYAFAPYKPSTGPIAGKWVGFKMIMYNMLQNGKTVVTMEIWVDANNTGNWLKVNEFVDSGGFGNAGGECGGAPDQIITWGGPIATYRWDNSPDVDIKDFSIREIQPPV